MAKPRDASNAVMQEYEGRERDREERGGLSKIGSAAGGNRFVEMLIFNYFRSNVRRGKCIV